MIRGRGIIKWVGLENFFYLPDSDGNMKYLPEDSYNFTLASILVEYKIRRVEPGVINDSAGNETPDSVLARFRCYDQYELCDFSILSDY